LHRFQNRQRALWSIAGLLLVALTAAFVFLSWTGSAPTVHGMVPESRQAALAGLLAMVVLFVIYAITQQRRLARLEEELHRVELREETMRARFEELEALFGASNELGGRVDLAGVLDLAARRVRRGLEADACVIYLVDPSGTKLLGLASGVENGRPRHAAVVTPGEGVTGLVHSTGETMVVDAGPLLGQLAAEMNLERAPGAGLCVPVRLGSRGLGVVNVVRFDGTNPYLQVHARMLESFANSLARAIGKTSENTRAAA
jgi:hypothetical protein